MLQLTAASETVKPDTTALIAERVRGEFREMPGLSLTLAQAGRLWSLDKRTCADVLMKLVETGYLCRKANGTFCRATDLSRPPLRLARV